MLSYLTIAIVAVSNKRPFGANSNTEGPAFKGADSRSRGTIWGTSEAHYCTTIHSNRVISAHAHYNLGQAEVKGEAVLIDSDVLGRARVKFVYHMTFQNDSYKLRMAWFLDLVWTGRIFVNIKFIISVYTVHFFQCGVSVLFGLFLSYYNRNVIPIWTYACLKQTNNVTDPLYLSFWDLVNNKVVSNDLKIDAS